MNATQLAVGLKRPLIFDEVFFFVPSVFTKRKESQNGYVVVHEWLIVFQWICFPIYASNYPASTA